MKQLKGKSFYLLFSMSAVLLSLLFCITANASQFAYIYEDNSTAKLCLLSPDASGNFTTQDTGLAFTTSQGEGQSNGEFGLLSLKHKGQQRLFITRKGGEIHIYDPSDFTKLLLNRDLSGEGIQFFSKSPEGEYKNHPVLIGRVEGEGWSIFEFNPETGAIVHSRVSSEKVDDIDKIAVADDNIFVTLSKVDFTNYTETFKIALIETSGKVINSADIENVEMMKAVDNVVYFTGENDNKTGIFSINSDLDVEEIFTSADFEGIDGFVSDGEGGFYFSAETDWNGLQQYHYDGLTAEKFSEEEGNVWFYDDGKLFLMRENRGQAPFLVILDSNGDFSQSFEINPENLVKIAKTDDDDEIIEANTVAITDIKTPSENEKENITNATFTNMSDIKEFSELDDTLQTVSNDLSASAENFQSVITFMLSEDAYHVLPYKIYVPATIEKSEDVKIYIKDTTSINPAAFTLTNVQTSNADDIIEADVYGTDYKALSSLEDGILIAAELEKDKIYSVYIAKAKEVEAEKEENTSVKPVNFDEINEDVAKNIASNLNFQSVDSLKTLLKTLNESDITEKTPATDALKKGLDNGFTISSEVATIKNIVTGYYVMSVDVPASLRVSPENFKIYFVDVNNKTFFPSSVSAAAASGIREAVVLGADGNKITEKIPASVYAASRFTTDGDYAMYIATASQTGENNIGKSSSGCNSGFALLSLLTLFAIFKKK